MYPNLGRAVSRKHWICNRLYPVKLETSNQLIIFELSITRRETYICFSEKARLTSSSQILSELTQIPACFFLSSQPEAETPRPEQHRYLKLSIRLLFPPRKPMMSPSSPRVLAPSLGQADLLQKYPLEGLDEPVPRLRLGGRFLQTRFGIAQLAPEAVRGLP